MASLNVMGQEISPRTLSSYDESACADLERACSVSEDAAGTVSCDRPTFSRSLVGCVDLWEAGRICAESSKSDRELWSLEIDVAEVRAQLAEETSDLWKRKAWTYGIIGVVGWGLAVGFLSAWLAK